MQSKICLQFMPKMEIRWWLAFILLGGNVLAYAGQSCLESGRQLFYHPNPLMKEHLGVGFADTLFQKLEKNLANLGHCLQVVGKINPKDSSSDHLGLWLTSHRQDETIRISAAILPESQKNRAHVEAAFLRPLTELTVQITDSGATSSFLAQKIIENLRTQFVAQLNIATDPDSALIRTNRGLTGKSPLEWVLPLGKIHISVSHPGYMTRKYDLDLSRPGEHTVNLPLEKRHFYHSNLFPITLGFLGASLGSYYLKNDYYDQYHQLGIEDQRQRPEEFSRLFGVAQNWEKAATASLVGALLTFGLSFRF
jgi:PEGA domain